MPGCARTQAPDHRLGKGRLGRAEDRPGREPRQGPTSYLLGRGSRAQEPGLSPWLSEPSRDRDPSWQGQRRKNVRQREAST